MVNGFIALRLAAIMLMGLLTVARAAGADICSEVRDTARNARDALLAYHDENMKYPDRLSSTTFTPPEHIVVIYENLNLSPSKEMFMVRAYHENCGSIYLAVPTTNEIFEIPASPENTKKATAKTTPGPAVPSSAPWSRVAFVASLATFLMVFVIIILVFYIFYRKPVSAVNPEKDRQSPANDGN